MTIKRVPLLSFHQFARLPVEVQDIIWEYSLEVPQVHSMGSFSDGLFLRNVRSPPLLAVCRATRSMMHKMRDQQFKSLPYKSILRKGEYDYYNPSLDTVRLGLDSEQRLRDFVQFDIRSLGVPFDSFGIDAWDTLESDIRLFHNMREIVFILGNSRANCATELVYVDESSPEVAKRYPHDDDSDRYVGVPECIQEVRAELESRHRKWKSYQRRREKVGKSSPDWVLPVVRVAVLRSLCSSATQYSYQHLASDDERPGPLPWGDIQ
jgi:hypothetical protein